MTKIQAKKLRVRDKVVYRRDARENKGEVVYVDYGKVVGITWDDMTDTIIDLVMGDTLLPYIDREVITYATEKLGRLEEEIADPKMTY